MLKSLPRMSCQCLIAMVLVSAAPHPISAAQATSLITLTTKPAPLLLGQNQFEVVVKDPNGRPVTDASVSLRLVMPPTPDMAEMRTDVALKPAGDGKYRGTGMMTMAGHWNATISVRRGGREIAQKQTSVSVVLRAPSTQKTPR